MEQWQIERTQGQCAGTDEAFEAGEEYYAALLDKQTTFERVDYSLSYWEKHKPVVYSFWKTRMPLPNQKKGLFVDDGVLINFFQRLETETEQGRINFRFVLTLILMRKRTLKYLDSRREDGVEIWKVQLVREKEEHEVINPQLDDEQIEKVSQELSTILRVDL